ncbi:hypothetical protein Aab01nite_58160 [Paractinoplanes abujensis]|uniref:Serine phosphatase RsbU (Regulator of sigma subunit)/anti-sigma regulatory factor (Ser/Thr protein kinase) n=1 Tax=Paractinoplanes abujensis TaxID=882441 RepID=A0A7W7G3E5_9ACTN|nr:SpoIIE family protein phosphatase [Actinoplanes abujensis]MBB4696233.1 serine phosphatase RsbU (regulator of sigma subunit)/anti-sigma regulatory factor (Ser/Thr protein kinase) [Actinoplanes abujensis]GID22226.1 hypothetical protein Aab01nite_58160 [Actinoplanes abujensis]
MERERPDSPAGDAAAARAVLDQLPVMVSAFAGPQHRFVVVNAAMRAFIGGRQILGVPIREAFPDVAGQQIFELVDRVWESGKVLTIPEMRIQFDADGSGTVQEFFVDWTGIPNRDDDGTVVGMIALFIDVTARVRERQAAQARATDAERRYAAVRGVVAEMQQALLPTALPVLPSVEIAASYLLADADTAAGGDWFDAFALPDGRLALIVGDVVGHGVAASATMGQLRVVLHERLAATGDLVAALEAVDRLATTVPGARAATVCVVVLDPRDGSLSYCTAGHPPPLVLSADKEARYLPITGAGPLGVGSHFGVAADSIGPAEIVLLYTDGILERPGRDVPGSTVELAGVASDVAADRALRGDPGTTTERLTTQTLELLTRLTGHSDDITLLAAARREPAPPLRLDLPAVPLTITLARSALNDWLHSIGAGEQDRVALEHAVVELVTNVNDHAHDKPADPTHTVTIAADLHDDGQLQLSVADTGRWREPPPDSPSTGGQESGPARGFGLAMTASLVDHLEILPTDSGTTVHVRRNATVPARLLTADQITHGLPTAAPLQTAAMRIVEQPEAPTPRIAIHGPLDATNTEYLGAELDRLTRGGTRELIVDLTEVTHLASAAVADLHRSRPDPGKYPLRLYAPAGSTAHHVLSLVNLPHETTDPHLNTPAPDLGA